ncbi:hypothetical protein HPB48_014047 [Haemaphysalis longicornis]|uniref:Uncharacterized protein n=1 Tax=Haemaphysalis longicornis TaxID=44386 RepID=A0A9J6G962_HAELO|nr:hypothetical protein HPB48_014047 [Haemaphysalis longicornis]
MTNCSTLHPDVIVQKIGCISNLLFFGIEDDVNEDWEASEKKLFEFCEENLEFTLTSQQFERVHRIGRSSPDKCQPIIAKFVLFKDKQVVQASTKKLKDTDYSISQDFSVATREAWKKLIEFAKPSKQAFKLRVDRLEMNGKTYVYDSSQLLLFGCSFSEVAK